MRCCVCECQIRHVWWSISISDLAVQLGTTHTHDLFACSTDCIETVQHTLRSVKTTTTMQAVVRQYLNNQSREINDGYRRAMIEDPFE